MAEGTTASNEIYDGLRQAYIGALRRQGGLTPQQIQDAADRFIVGAQRAKLTEAQASAVQGLLLKRAEYADRQAQYLQGAGNTAATSQINLQTGAYQAQIDAAKLAAAENVQNLSIGQKFRSTLQGWVLAIGAFCEHFGAADAAQSCKNLAEKLKPDMIQADLSQLNRLKTGASIDTNPATQTLQRIFPAVLDTTDPAFSRLDPSATADYQRIISNIPGTNATSAPSYVGPGGSAPATAAPATNGAASAPVNGAAFMNDKELTASLERAGLKADVAGRIARGAVAADADGSKSLNSSAEVKDFESRPAYKALDAAGKSAVNKALGLPEPAPN